MLEQRARRLTHDIFAHHADDIAVGGEEIRNAVIVKSVALLVLTYGIAPTGDGNLDIEFAFLRLMDALAILARFESRELDS